MEVTAFLFGIILQGLWDSYPSLVGITQFLLAPIYY
jgi:hypothetical protein